MNLKTLCASCMEDDSGAPVCPRCGAPFQSSVVNPLLLSPRMLLRDQYMIGRALGHGGFGITYIAWDIGLETRLAVKEYMPAGVAYRANQTTVAPVSESAKEDYDWGLDRFMEEARVLKRRNHSNIVLVDTVFRDNGTAYLVMEYLDGMTFEEFLRSRGGVIPFEDALRVLSPAMDALNAVHIDEVLHRDVSPDNIFITKTGKIKLIDFGAARQALNQKSRKLTVILKAGFTPEEQYRVNGQQGPWTDVYATAATLYRAITGKIPPGALDRQAEDTLELPSRLGVAIPATAERALMKGLAVRGVDRFRSMDDFKKALVGSMPAGAPVTMHAPAAAVNFSPGPAMHPTDKAVNKDDDPSSLEAKIKKYETRKLSTAPAPAIHPAIPAVVEPATQTPLAAPPTPRPPLPKWAVPALAGILVLILGGGLAWRHWKSLPPSPTTDGRTEWPAQPAGIPQSDLERQHLLDLQTQQNDVTPPVPEPAPPAPTPEPGPQEARQQPAPVAPAPLRIAPKPAAPAPAPALSYDDMLTQAQALTAKQQYSDAKTLLNSAVQANPAASKAYNELARLELYNLNQPTQAFDHYRAALKNGGQATFRVVLEHGSGWLTVSNGKAAFKDDTGNHTFAMSDVQEAKKNKSDLLKVGKGHNAFRIRLASGEKYNVEPTSLSPGPETDFILSVLEP
jgi:serine/threonine protein kinase